MSWHQLQNIKNVAFLWRVQIKSVSYKKAHVSMSVLNELGKRFNMRGLSSILVIFFCNEFD